MNGDVTTEDLLRDPDFFRCERLTGRPVMRKAVCLARQREIREADESGTGPRTLSLDYCRHCEQGREIAESLADRRSPACAVEGCDLRATCRGLCANHYAAWRRGVLKEFGPWHPGPGHAERIKTEKEEKGMPSKEPKEKICERCGNPKPIDEFQRHARSKTGRANICKECISKATTEGAKKKKADNGAGIYLDLSRYPEISESLPDAAHREIRTPEMQAIAYIVRGLKADGYGQADMKE